MSVSRQSFWQNPWVYTIIGGAIAAVIAALVLGAINNPTPSSSTPNQNPGPADSSTSVPSGGGAAWLDQLTPTSGQVSSSNATPDTSAQGSYSPLPHQVIIAPAGNGNNVTYRLGGAYKTLNLQVATTGGSSVSSATSFSVSVDGKTLPLLGQTTVKDFFPGLTQPQDWILNVSGTQNLQFTLTDTNGGQGTSLLVSGHLTG